MDGEHIGQRRLYGVLCLQEQEHHGGMWAGLGHSRQWLSVLLGIGAQPAWLRTGWHFPPSRKAITTLVKHIRKIPEQRKLRAQNKSKYSTASPSLSRVQISDAGRNSITETLRWLACPLRDFHEKINIERNPFFSQKIFSRLPGWTYFYV